MRNMGVQIRLMWTLVPPVVLLSSFFKVPFSAPYLALACLTGSLWIFSYVLIHKSKLTENKKRLYSPSVALIVIVIYRLSIFQCFDQAEQRTFDIWLALQFLSAYLFAANGSQMILQRFFNVNLESKNSAEI